MNAITWRIGSASEANPLLARAHYLGPMRSGRLVVVGSVGDAVAACQVWKLPTSRHLPNDGTWLELARWCLTSQVGDNAGSRMHKYAARLIRDHGDVRTLISYSDPSVGHTGALYRACNWVWAPQWQRLRTPPTGGGTWDGIKVQVPKDRWVFHVTKEDAERTRLYCTDAGAIRHWLRTAPATELGWARRSPYMRGHLPSSNTLKTGVAKSTPPTDT